MLLADKNSITSSFLILMPFISFYCLTSLGRASRSSMYIDISFYFLAFFCLSVLSYKQILILLIREEISNTIMLGVWLFLVQFLIQRRNGRFHQGNEKRTVFFHRVICQVYQEAQGVWWSSQDLFQLLSKSLVWRYKLDSLLPNL